MGRNEEFEAGSVPRWVQYDIEPVTAHVVAQYHNQHGGSSFYVHGAERATSGYAVGGLEGTPETITEQRDMTPEEYQAHRDRVRESTTLNNAIAGTWVENDKSVMDASEAIPDRDEAREMQVEREQRAVYNLDKDMDEDLTQDPLPHPTPRRDRRKKK